VVKQGVTKVITCRPSKDRVLRQDNLNIAWLYLFFHRILLLLL
jgi:hypothetical protein